MKEERKSNEDVAMKIMEKLGHKFNYSYIDNGKEDNKPDLQYLNGRFLEITHTEHRRDALYRKPNNYLPTLDEIKKQNERTQLALSRYFKEGYSKENLQTFREDRNYLNKLYGLDDSTMEISDNPSYRFGIDNIERIIKKKESKHKNKDIDLFVFVASDELRVLKESLKGFYSLGYFKDEIYNSCFKNIFLCEYEFETNLHKESNCEIITFDILNKKYEIFKIV